MNFQEADLHYQRLQGMVQSGTLSYDQFQSEVQKIQVMDAYSRIWMKQIGSGQWFVLTNNQWMAAIPPGYENNYPPEDEIQLQEPVRKKTRWVLPLVIAIFVRDGIINSIGNE